jgi:hypothetical protein
MIRQRLDEIPVPTVIGNAYEGDIKLTYHIFTNDGDYSNREYDLVPTVCTAIGAESTIWFAQVAPVSKEMFETLNIHFYGEDWEKVLTGSLNIGPDTKYAAGLKFMNPHNPATAVASNARVKSRPRPSIAVPRRSLLMTAVAIFIFGSGESVTVYPHGLAQEQPYDLAFCEFPPPPQQGNVKPAFASTDAHLHEYGGTKYKKVASAMQIAEVKEAASAAKKQKWTAPDYKW